MEKDESIYLLLFFLLLFIIGITLVFIILFPIISIEKLICKIKNINKSS